MSAAKQLHRYAMELADRALGARRLGHDLQAKELFREAFRREREALNMVLESAESTELTRSILRRSAATLALDCGDFKEAESLVMAGLSEAAPGAIKQEFLQLEREVTNAILFAHSTHPADEASLSDRLASHAFGYQLGKAPSARSVRMLINEHEIASSQVVHIDTELLRQLRALVASDEVPHPFAERVTRDSVLPTMRGIIALAEALPAILSPIPWKEEVGDWGIASGDVLTAADEPAVQGFIKRIVERHPPDDRTLSLRREFTAIFGWELQPDYSTFTLIYLWRLYASLNASDHVNRIAAAAALEIHTDAMMRALRYSLHRVLHFPESKMLKLVAHLLEITSISTGTDIPADQMIRFVEAFYSYYQLSLQWSFTLSSIGE